MDYKDTLLLPKTDFPMRAELPKREPEILAKWRAENVYAQIMAARQGQPRFVLHDGPPFANGDAHMGHALNMVLKDIVLKYHNMKGDYAPFVPGWDCHGLPIEHKVMKDLGADETDPVKIREKCEATARKFIGVQSEQFQRLGVFGDWENPYLTLDPKYEAETLRVFATLVGKDLVYQGLRPVLWSTGCQTALAEAEIEYKEKIDPAIYVKFPLTPDAASRIPELKDASLLIWTTTPWTLPANLAVAVAPGLDYALYQVGADKILFHTKLVDAISAAYDRHQAKGDAGAASGHVTKPKLIAGPWKGADLVGLTYAHPFLSDSRTRQIFTADFVTADAGTGLVHGAPGHGQDDYQMGQQHGLPAFSPVDDRGCLTAEAGVPELTGVYVFKANPIVIRILEEKGKLFAHEDYTHDYPHCWRSKTPIVYRAVKQWFIKVDAFRQQALDEIEKVEWIPASGKNRIRGAVESRPDWCISRQRTWGIPLPVFYGEGEQPLLSDDVVRAFATLVETQGAGIWFSKSADELAALITTELEKAGSKARVPLGLRKGRDTLDVWIDSGTSWAAVVEKRDDLKPAPADLYLEGSDQHRGWFQSSLLTSVAATGKAPYRSVLTNGFVVDLDGKKLSKSSGKPIDLMTLVNKHGADVMRLWVASQDYADDVPFSDKIFDRVADTYRSIRNTLRILLGNLHDFDPAKYTERAPVSGRQVDVYYFKRFLKLAEQVEEAYASYNFSQVYQLINRFCAVDLSAQYVDLLKDRLYCDAPNSESRQAAQWTLYHILGGLTELIAPIIPFTAEETWGFMRHQSPHKIVTKDGKEISVSPWRNPNRPESVHEQRVFARVKHSDAEKYAEHTARYMARWESILAVRSRVNEKLEEARREKKIGKSLEACVEIKTKEAFYEGAIDPTQLDEVFLVSKLVVTPTEGEETITVTRAEDHGMKKCVRCWKYWDHVGSNAQHLELCDRCTKVVLDFKG